MTPFAACTNGRARSMGIQQQQPEAGSSGSGAAGPHR